MSYNKEKIEKITKKIWNIISTIIKSLIVLLIIGWIMIVISTLGAEVYTLDSSDRNYSAGWNYEETLNIFYGLIGIIIYILINYSGFVSYKYITNKFKNYNIKVGKIIFIIFSIFINFVMLLVYSGIFGSFSFENILLEILNKVIVFFGWIIFPVIFSIIYKKS